MSFRLAGSVPIAWLPAGLQDDLSGAILTDRISIIFKTYVGHDLEVRWRSLVRFGHRPGSCKSNWIDQRKLIAQSIVVGQPDPLVRDRLVALGQSR